MALQLNKTIKGYNYSYWKIIGVYFNVFDNTEIKIGLFKDIVTSEYVDNLVDTREYSVRWAKDIFTTENVLQSCYVYVKTQDEFKTAENI
jgi:hypothetical protein